MPPSFAVNLILDEDFVKNSAIVGTRLTGWMQARENNESID